MNGGEGMGQELLIVRRIVRLSFKGERSWEVPRPAKVGMARRWHGRPAREGPTFSSAEPGISGFLSRSLFMGETPMPPQNRFPLWVERPEERV